MVQASPLASVPKVSVSPAFPRRGFPPSMVFPQDLRIPVEEPFWASSCSLAPVCSPPAHEGAAFDRGSADLRRRRFPSWGHWHRSRSDHRAARPQEAGEEAGTVWYQRQRKNWKRASVSPEDHRHDNPGF